MEMGGIILISAVIALMYHIAIRDDYIKKYGKNDGDKKVWMQTFISFVIIIVFMSLTFR